MKKIILFIFIALIIGSCITTYEELLDSDIEDIEAYIEENNLDAKKLESGVFVVIDVEGGEEKPDLNSDIVVDYKGYYLDDEVFDSSYATGDPLEIKLSGLIEGWQIGLQEFGRGGKGMILIPSGLGYGVFPPAGIRKNAVLLFDIELIDFE